ncbi:homogentisate 1,2-dioxygenase [Acrasis kona]|uniref:homogentisate 1,2-dioxygenase n=1 Tax=Acrasis kona TaxID=1008807 RepID=A0AAW2YXH9_9EUKA
MSHQTTNKCSFFDIETYGDDFKYLQGFGSTFSSESLEGALPVGQNCPQKCPYGLYAEQISGTAFTAPRVRNQRTWFYRIRPSVVHYPFHPHRQKENSVRKVVSEFGSEYATPQQLRWLPTQVPKEEEIDFVDGLTTMAGAGNAAHKSGFAIHMYHANKSMNKRAFCSADGDFLIVPQSGKLHIQTECGWLSVRPKEICVVPRGIRFSVQLKECDSASGYIAELFEGHFTLPDLGPIGANGLANPRDFCYPTACYEDVDDIEYEVIQKYQGKLFCANTDHSVFDVVAWHGNYAPYKYNLTLFNTINSVSFDHIDPCIFTVITAQSNDPGVAVLDFVIFPPRHSVQENTFRPPYFHRNTMNEFMGLIEGKYEAKQTGFLPGGASLHNCMSPHGPDRDTFEKASNAELVAEKVAGGSLAFMFESTYMINPTEWAMTQAPLDKEYHQAWVPLEKHFSKDRK